MNPTNLKRAAAAVAVTISLGGAVAIDQNQAAIPLACDTATSKIVDLNEKLLTYRIDEGFINTREMTLDDRSNIKGCEIAKSVSREVIAKDNYTIEIVDIEPIEKGVQVFARAWLNGEQIGFGPKGNVDIERFRIFNPPILVPDEAGEIIVENSSYDPITDTVRNSKRTFREDPKQALVGVLIDTISVMDNATTGAKIEIGKRGNTTSTIYSGNDATLYDNLTGGSFVTSRNAATGDGVLTGSPNWGFLARENTYLYRGVLPFDTSGIPDSDTISSATFSIKPSGSYNNGCSVTAYIAPIALADPTAPAIGDWDAITYTDYGNRVWSAASVGTYFDITMTSAGLSGINKTGYTSLAYISNYDFNNTAPCNTTSNNGSEHYYSEQAGTTDDPKLVVEHTGSVERRIIRTTPQ